MKDLFDYTVPTFEEFYAGLWLGIFIAGALLTALMLLVMWI